jgi:hypothetical protein
VKNSKKFSENCLVIADKRHGIASIDLSLIFVIGLTWLIPALFRNNVKSAFTYVQIPIDAASTQLETCEMLLPKGLFLGEN